MKSKTESSSKQSSAAMDTTCRDSQTGLATTFQPRAAAALFTSAESSSPSRIGHHSTGAPDSCARRAAHSARPVSTGPSTEAPYRQAVSTAEADCAGLDCNTLARKLVRPKSPCSGSRYLAYGPNGSISSP